MILSLEKALRARRTLRRFYWNTDAPEEDWGSFFAFVFRFFSLETNAIQGVFVSLSFISLAQLWRFEPGTNHCIFIARKGAKGAKVCKCKQGALWCGYSVGKVLLEYMF